MARTRFGHTWWGAQWLQALHAVDWDNRLPRGRRYANNGSVQSLRMDDARVAAKVKGSRRTPYAVTLEMPALPAEASDRLVDAIAADPALIGRLLNRELDPAILDHAEAQGIHIFPRDWQDVDMHCSCPDWATPCKHIAAVIYLLSREIDADPFQVFRLRGVELIEAMERRGLGIAQQARAELPSLADILPGQTAAAGGDAPAKPPERIDFTALPALLERLLHALPQDPGFSAATTAHKAWRTQLRRVARRATRTLDALGGDTSEPTDTVHHLGAEADPTVTVDREGGIRVEDADGESDLHTLLELLERLGSDALVDHSPRLAGWQHVRSAALHLLAAGAAVPRLFALPRDGAGCLWMPALLDAEVRAVLGALAAALPADLVRLQKGRRREPLMPLAQASLACGLMMDHFIREWAEIPAGQVDDKVVGLLFVDGCEYFDAPGEHGLAERMHLWLSRLQLAERTCNPVLSLTEDAADDAFHLAMAVEPRGGAAARPVPLAEVLADDGWQDARAEVLQTASLLAEFYPALHDYVSAGAREPLTIPALQMPELLFNVFPAMQLLGIRVLLPKALERTLRPQVSVAVEGEQEAPSGYLSADDLFRFDWRVAVGEHSLTREEFEALVADAQGVVRFRGEYVFLDPGEIERLRKQLDKPPQLSGTDVTRIALAEEYAGAPVTLDEQARDHIRRLTDTEEVALPAGLQAELRPYQQRGYSWLYRNARAGLGSILADDMGLGKTLQTIAAIQRLKEDGALEQAWALVIVPTSLLTNWQREVERFAPALSVAVYHGSERSLESDHGLDIVLTTYGTARRDAARLKRRAWRLLVVDEAQNVKNPSAAQTRAIKSIPARASVALSGTPVENRLVEYWSVMDLVNRGYLGSRKAFESDYGKPIQVHGDEHAAERFRRITAPFLMRRLKSDKRIISDLPEKIVQDQFCEMTPEQSAMYESVVREAMQVIEGESDTFQRQGLVLQMIMALKQVCNHPGHYTKQAQPDVAGSGKGLRFLELLDAAYRQQEKVLVFTQFREMGEILRRWAGERFGQPPAFLHGGLGRRQRDAMVRAFQDNPASRVLILSLKAGGTGLNLTAASQVIHYDLWWNPAVEDQATDRAYRIGQTRGVQVHRLITRHTFEERINEMITAKRGLADMTVTAGEQWIGQLSDAELRELFTMHEPGATEPAAVGGRRA